MTIHRSLTRLGSAGSEVQFAVERGEEDKLHAVDVVVVAAGTVRFEDVSEEVLSGVVTAEAVDTKTRCEQ